MHFERNHVLSKEWINKNTTRLYKIIHTYNKQYNASTRDEARGKSAHGKLLARSARSSCTPIFSCSAPSPFCELASRTQHTNVAIYIYVFLALGQGRNDLSLPPPFSSLSLSLTHSFHFGPLPALALFPLRTCPLYLYAYVWFDAIFYRDVQRTPRVLRLSLSLSLSLGSTP